MTVFVCAALLSATINFASPGPLGLRLVFALVVVLVIGVELVAGKIRPDFAAIEAQATELMAAVNDLKAQAATTHTDTTVATTGLPAHTPTAPATDTATPSAPVTPAPETPAPLPATADNPLTDDVPARLVSAARMITVQHRQTSTQPITADELAARLNTTPAIAARLLATIDNPARINGNTPALGGAR